MNSDLSASEKIQHLQRAGVKPKPPIEQRDVADESKFLGSQKWENVPSTTSSLPSMSFPEPSAGTSPEPCPSNRRASQPTTIPASTRRRQSATLAIFDPSLPASARLTAFFSSLVINLPFVNGVMLGFGEIFAKNVVLKWLGWKQPGSVAANVGLRERDERKQHQS
jgi:hypothetical protein